jgi:hypothetical protein
MVYLGSSAGQLTLGVMASQVRTRRWDIDSWLDLARLTHACATGKWIFRGESSDIRDGKFHFELLRPKAGRVSSVKGAARKVPHRASDERRGLEDYIRQARPHLNHTPLHALEWLAIAQHHGMSTRLLDWTESLLVAAYFATLRSNTGVGLIYGVQGLRTLTKREERNPFALAGSGIYRPPHITPRIPAQRSVFTVHPRPTEEFRPRGRREWLISPVGCNEIRRVLDACAVNESSIFPDLDGLSRYVGWRYKWGKV